MRAPDVFIERNTQTVVALIVQVLLPGTKGAEEGKAAAGRDSALAAGRGGSNLQVINHHPGPFWNRMPGQITLLRPEFGHAFWPETTNIVHASSEMESGAPS